MTNSEQPLPGTRKGNTYELVIHSDFMGRTKFYLRTGEYPDGRLGEIFIDSLRQESFFRHALNGWAMLFSLALQNGIPLARLVHMFTGLEWEPKGRVNSPIAGIDKCASPFDLVVQVLKSEYGAKQS